MHANVMQVSSVIAVGLVEGSSHVHWRLVYKTLIWWTFGFLLTMVITTFLVAQGLLPMSMLKKYMLFCTQCA